MERIARNKTIVYAYLTAFIWPLIGMVLAVLNYKSGYAKNILWIFCAFFGYTFIVSDPYMDANRYRDALKRAHIEKNEPLLNVLTAPYVNKGKYAGTDFYSHTITVFVSRFTDDFRVFFGFIGLIFGFFYSRNLFFIIAHIKEKKLIVLSVLLLLVTALIIPFWNINGYRYYTAAQVFLFGLLNGFFSGKRRFWIIVILSPAIHFSFFFPVAILFLYFLTGRNLWISVGFLLISLFFVNLSPEFINQNAKLAPVFMQNKVEGYSADYYVEMVSSLEVGQNWYVRGHMYALNFSLYLFIGLTVLNRRKWLVRKDVKRLFVFGVMMLAAANLVSSIPSMGRFYTVAALLLCISFILIIQNDTNLKVYKSLTYVLTVPLLIFIVVAVRIGLDYIGLNTLFLNPFLAPFFPDSPALIEFIK